MQTVSAADFQKMYGTQGIAKFAPAQPQSGGMGQDISSAFKGGVDYAKQGYQDAKVATNPIQKLEAGLKEGVGAVGAALSPLAPATKYIGKGINAAANKLSENPLIKGAAGNLVQETDGTTSYKPNQGTNNVMRGLEDTQNTATLLGLRSGGEAPGVVGAGVDAVNTVGKGVGETASKAGNYMGTAVKDIVPTTQGVINHQVSKALDLTPGDLSKIDKSTGNDVGTWLSDHNLIGENKAATQKNINDFFDTNYKAVRDEIGNVQTTYKPSQVPRYIDALKQIESKIENVPGLEKEWVDVSTLLGKKEISLSDVQQVKELLDKHFNLYKVTGDVGEGVAKEGLANMRGELRGFIEKQVLDNGGQDIHELNNHVATAKSLGDAITTRSTKGLTTSNLKLGDLGIFGVGMSFGGPLAGAALVFGKKLLETPTVRLRVARYLDQVSDAQKAKIQATMQQGKIPPEFNQFIKKPKSDATK